MRAPSRMAGIRTKTQPVRRLTRLTDSLWVDLDAIESVQTYTARNHYHRMVKVTTTSGQVHTVRAVHVNPYRAATNADHLLAEYLDAHFGDLLRDGGESDG